MKAMIAVTALRPAALTMWMLISVFLGVSPCTSQGACSWSALGTGIDGPIYELAVLDDGSGPALYAAGDFLLIGGVAANRIAKWDGTVWSALGSGIAGTYVHAVATFDDGTGPGLYAAGAFGGAGGVSASNIA